MRRIINIQTGEETQVPETQEELDAAVAQRAAEAAAEAQRLEDEKDTGKWTKREKAIVKWIATLHSIPMAQAKADLKAIFESLP